MSRNKREGWYFGKVYVLGAGIRRKRIHIKKYALRHLKSPELAFAIQLMDYSKEK